MTEMRFYHLQRSSLERALPALVHAAYQQNNRILVQVPDPKEAERLTEVLWSYDEQSFLPHGTKADGDPGDQPIFLTSEHENANNANVVVLTQGTSRDDLSDFEMCCDMFDGNHEETLQAARARWKSFKDEGKFDLSYYQQNNSGGWEKKA